MKEFRNSKLMILTNFLKTSILPVYVFGKAIKRGEELTKERILIYIGLCLVYLVFTVFLSYFKWKNTYLLVDGNELTYYKRGLFKRAEKRASVKDITNINQRAEFINNLFGITNVMIDLNSSETSMVTDFQILLKKDEAFELEKLLRGNEKREEIVEKTNHEVYLTRELSKKECRRHWFLENGMKLIYTIAGAIVLIAEFEDSKLFIFGILAGIIFIIRDIVKKSNSITDFKVERDKKKIFISYGLTTKSEYTILISNISSVGIKQTLLGKIFGYQFLKIEAIGIEDNDKGASNKLSLFMKKDRIREFAEEFIPEFKVYTEVDPLPKKMFFYYLIQTILVAGVLQLAVSFVVDLKAIYYMVYYLIMLIIVVYRYGSIGASLVEEGVLVGEGFIKNYRLIPFKKLELAKVRTNPIYNLLGLERTSIFFRGTLGRDSVTRIIYPKGQFEEVIDRCKKGEVF